MTFNEKLKKARKNKSLTQAELAEKIGVTARSVQNYELGARYPKRDILARICKVLGVRIETLVWYRRGRGRRKRRCFRKRTAQLCGSSVRRRRAVRRGQG